MPDSNKNLGKLVAVYGIAPAYLQRVVFIVVLSFVFFLAMMFTFYIRQNIVYFLLSSAFLAVYLVTLFSWVMQRRNVVTVHEKGVNYKKRPILWHEIDSLNGTGTILVRGEKPIVVPSFISRREQLFETILKKIDASNTTR